MKEQPSLPLVVLGSAPVGSPLCSVTISLPGKLFGKWVAASRMILLQAY